jgi:hypothetical protein
VKTYLTIWFSSEGSKVSFVTDRLLSLGFQPLTGAYDYVYDWGNSTTVEEAIWFGDKIQETLKGSDVMFKIETV